MGSERKFAFIIAVNNEIYFEECAYYINRLLIPEGYAVDIFAIQEADSMCAAYNLGMQNSDAKYKIYLHQDVFIRNQNFLNELLRIFKGDESVGMVGMMGGNGMPKTGVTYLAWNVGLVDCRDADMAYYLSGGPDITEDMTVEAVDGLLIATQYDVSWREELFKDFDFYDVSQSFEMRRRGYDIVVPYQSEPWVIHDSSFAKLGNYDANRKICLEEYPEYLYAEDGMEFEYCGEWDALSGELARQMKQWLEDDRWENVCSVIEEYRRGRRKDSTLEMLGVMADIWKAEKEDGVEPGFFAVCSGYQQIYKKYIRIRFLLRRMELSMPEEAYQELSDAIMRGEISGQALQVLVLHSTVDKRCVFKKLEELYRRAGAIGEAQRLHMISGKVVCFDTPVTYTQRVQKERESRC